ncbi:unnamed protein product [marine sediment metagenome]|uniref:Uncharacterized protein n=1 Tax=marine sediment metagenome TaxID=412755 RepID=X1CCB8_9ZZZZ
MNNLPPVLKVYNSYGDLVEIIELYADYDYLENVNYTEEQVSEYRFTVDLPNLPEGDEVCSIETVKLNESSHEFSYFIDDQIYITLFSQQDLDGVYNITIDFGVSNTTHSVNQFIGDYSFQSLPQDNYTMIGEFYDISGEISIYTIPQVFTIDYHGPEIYQQFGVDHPINPESGSISFIIDDFSSVDHYSLNISSKVLSIQCYVIIPI